MSKPNSKESIKRWIHRQRQTEWDNLAPGDQKLIRNVSRKVDKRVGKHVRKVRAGIRERAPVGRAMTRDKIREGAHRLVVGIIPKRGVAGTPKRRRKTK